MTTDADHLDDDIELYALGMLDGGERERIESHATGCSPCAARLGAAESTVAAMLDATIARHAPAGIVRRPVRRVTPLTAVMAAAAALALAAGGFAREAGALHGDIAVDGTIFAAMIDSHFSHTQFVSPRGAPIAAKAIYEPHGAWYRVIAYGIEPSARVVALHDGIATRSEGFVRRGDVLLLDAAFTGAIGELRIVDSRGGTIGVVHPRVMPPAVFRDTARPRVRSSTK